MVLFLSDVGGSEIVLILVFMLLFFGSKSIPGIARTFGRTIRQIKDASQELQDEIKKSGADMRKDLNLDGLLDRATREIEAPMEDISSEINNTMRYEKSAYFQQPTQLDPNTKTDEVQTLPDQPEQQPTPKSDPEDKQA